MQFEGKEEFLVHLLPGLFSLLFDRRLHPAGRVTTIPRVAAGCSAPCQHRVSPDTPADPAPSAPPSLQRGGCSGASADSLLAAVSLMGHQVWASLLRIQASQHPSRKCTEASCGKPNRLYQCRGLEATSEGPPLPRFPPVAVVLLRRESQLNDIPKGAFNPHLDSV